MCFHDTDFHSWITLKKGWKTDNENRRSAPVTVEDDVFIGAHRRYHWKGSIIGAGSVVGKINSSRPDLGRKSSRCSSKAFKLRTAAKGSLANYLIMFIVLGLIPECRFSTMTLLLSSLRLDWSVCSCSVISKIDESLQPVAKGNLLHVWSSRQ